MRTNDTVVTGQLLPPVRDNRKLISLATALDKEIRREIEVVQTSLSKVAELLSKMYDSDLWRYGEISGLGYVRTIERKPAAPRAHYEKGE